MKQQIENKIKEAEPEGIGMDKLIEELHESVDLINQEITLVERLIQIYKKNIKMRNKMLKLKKQLMKEHSLIRSKFNHNEYFNK